jgi:hypothetical protein
MNGMNGMNICLDFQNVPEQKGDDPSWVDSERKFWLSAANAWKPYLPQGSALVEKKRNETNAHTQCDGGTIRVMKANDAMLSAMNIAAAAPSHYAVLHSDTIIVHDQLWSDATPEQRRYVVRHNVGHMLGFDHDTCENASVMTQQQAKDKQQTLHANTNGVVPNCKVTDRIHKQALLQTPCLRLEHLSGRVYNACSTLHNSMHDPA